MSLTVRGRGGVREALIDNEVRGRPRFLGRQVKKVIQGENNQLSDPADMGNRMRTENRPVGSQ